jgi:hypothetical protein
VYSPCFSDRVGLRQRDVIRNWNVAFLNALKIELKKNHKRPIDDDELILDALMKKRRLLNELSSLHLEALTNFQRSSPRVEFPELHKELFSKMERNVQERDLSIDC